jgi:NADH:ubiquinone reductase (non-electrogenic)
LVRTGHRRKRPSRVSQRQTPDPVPRPAGNRPRLVILGTGFAAFHLVTSLDKAYDLTIISPRNHFLFTPLLPSTTVGTVEFRSIIEPIRHARQGLRFYHAEAEEVDLRRKILHCVGAAAADPFDVPYDILVIAVGAVSNTFGVPGVATYARFLKELNDARLLRQEIVRCFERANLPGVSAQESERLLHFVVCGGGPTGIEFAAELHDFLTEDLARSYPNLVRHAVITILEASPQILSSFDDKLRQYAQRLFRRERIRILTDSPVIRVTGTQVTLKNRTTIPYGLLLWSTGIGPTPFVRQTPFPRDSRDRILVDSFFAVKGLDGVYAIGDCATLENTPLPATAQVAQQEGKYLARALNHRARRRAVATFRYRNLGMLAYIGGNRALADLDDFQGQGRAAWLFWRSAYLTRIVSLKNKVLVLIDWMKAMIFGRDTSQF